MKMPSIDSKKMFLLLSLSSLISLGAQGCVATRDWVTEKIDPLASRLSNNENQLGQFGDRLSGTEGRLGQVDAKAEQALSRLGNLRLERRFVLDLKEGANFAFNSSALAGQAKKEVDAFLSDLKGDMEEMNSAVFLIAGHTDSMGSDEYNYELGKKRAENVARYLIINKKMDPLRVITVSYGKSLPLADNKNREGRSKNRRVEILVYREAIGTASSNGDAAAGLSADARLSAGPAASAR